MAEKTLLKPPPTTQHLPVDGNEDGNENPVSSAAPTTVPLDQATPGTPAAEQVTHSPYLVQRLFDTKENNLFNYVKFHLIRDRIEDLTPPNPRVLDIGCGLKVAHSFLSGLGLQHEYFGVDYESEFNPDAVVDLMSLDRASEDYPWEPDALLLLDVLEHLHEDIDVLDGILKNAAKQCGRSTVVLISVPQMYRLDRFKLSHLHYPEHKIRLTQKEWCELIGKHFHISSVRGYGYLSVIPYLPMASRRYQEKNQLGKLFHFLRGRFFEWSPFKPIDLILSKLLGGIPGFKTWSNGTLIVARPYDMHD